MFARFSRLIGAGFLLVLGVIGLIVPLVPGIALLCLGAALLGRHKELLCWMQTWRR